MYCEPLLSSDLYNATFLLTQSPELLDFDGTLESPGLSMVSIRAIEPAYWRELKSRPLTQRELDVLRLIVEGYGNSEIAQKLYLSIGTVKTHVRNILTKFNVTDRTHAAVIALRSGLVN